MRNAKLTVAIACALCGALPAGAQHATGSGTSGGSLSPRILYAYQYADSGTGLQRHSWIRSIVLWRGQPASDIWKPRDTAAAAAASRTWRAVHHTAEDSGWTILGGMTDDVVRTAELRNGGAQLYVLGRRYTVPEGDSTLMVMVDRADGVGGQPTIAGVTYLRVALQDEFWPRMWTHGDTLFSVRPHNQAELLALALSTLPAVAAFIR